MDCIYLEQIMKDLKDMNINEFKRECERILFDAFKAIEMGDSSTIKVGKIKIFVEKKYLRMKTKKFV